MLLDYNDDYYSDCSSYYSYDEEIFDHDAERKQEATGWGGLFMGFPPLTGAL